MRGNALVTGGSRGIGRACAIALAEHGADVAITYLEHREAAELVAAEVRDRGRRAVVLHGDVADARAAIGLVDAAVEQLGPLRYLVCSAADGEFGSLAEMTPEGLDFTMAAHARALVLLSEHAARSMSIGGGGAIVAISSVGAHRVFDGYGAFGAAKAAVEALVRYLAAELGPRGIRANSVAAGVVLTDLFRHLPDWEAIATSMADRSPLRTVLDPEDVAEAVVFLLSDAARRITGQTLIVDAGSSLRG